MTKGITQFECPVCKATGDVPASEKDQAVAKTKCPQCSAILMVNPRSGSVEAHKAGLKDAPRLGEEDSPFGGGASSVSSMAKQKDRGRDWPAVVVVLAAVLVLIVAGIWLFPLILRQLIP